MDFCTVYPIPKKGVLLKTKRSIYSLLLCVTPVLLSACLFEEVEELEERGALDIPQVSAFEYDSRAVYSGQREVLAIPIEVNSEPDEGDESDRRDPPLNIEPRNYSCDHQNNYVAAVETFREELPLLSGTSFEICASRCDMNKRSCTGYFYVRSFTDHYCGYLATSDTEGQRKRLSAFNDSRLCYAQVSIPPTGEESLEDSSKESVDEKQNDFSDESIEELESVNDDSPGYSCIPAGQVEALRFEKQVFSVGDNVPSSQCEAECNENSNVCEGFLHIDNSTDHYCGFFRKGATEITEMIDGLEEYESRTDLLPTDTVLCFW